MSPGCLSLRAAAGDPATQPHSVEALLLWKCGSLSLWGLGDLVQDFGSGWEVLSEMSEYAWG